VLGGTASPKNFGPNRRVPVGFYHLCEYLSAVGRRHKAGDKGWLKQQQSRLKKGRWKQVLKELEGMEEAAGMPDELAVARNARRHLANRTAQLWYDEALELERSIGSGLIEGSHRHVVAATPQALRGHGGCPTTTRRCRTCASNPPATTSMNSSP
jgi:hypothetical protein